MKERAPTMELMGDAQKGNGIENATNAEGNAIGNAEGRYSDMQGDTPSPVDLDPNAMIGEDARAMGNIAHPTALSPSDPDSLDVVVVHVTHDSVLESARAIRKRLESSMQRAMEPDQFETTASSNNSTVHPQPMYTHDNVNMAQRATINCHPDTYWEEPRRHLVCDLARRSDRMSISLAQVAQASINLPPRPSHTDIQQLTNATETAAAYANAAATAAENANKAAAGLSAIATSITLAAATFEKKLNLATSAFGEHIKQATENLTTQVQASEMRIQNTTDAVAALLTVHAETLTATLTDEYNHLFGQLSGHVYTAIDAKIDEKAEGVSADIATLVKGAQRQHQADTIAFDNESVKAHSSLARALTSVKSSITTTATDATSSLEMECKQHVLSLQNEAAKLKAAIAMLRPTPAPAHGTDLNESNTAMDAEDGLAEPPPRIPEDPDPRKDAVVENTESETPAAPNECAPTSHQQEGVWRNQFPINQTGIDHGVTATGRVDRKMDGRSQDGHVGPGRGHCRPI